MAIVVGIGVVVDMAVRVGVDVTVAVGMLLDWQWV